MTHESWQALPCSPSAVAVHDDLQENTQELIPEGVGYCGSTHCQMTDTHTFLMGGDTGAWGMLLPTRRCYMRHAPAGARTMQHRHLPPHVWAAAVAEHREATAQTRAASEAWTEPAAVWAEAVVALLEWGVGLLLLLPLAESQTCMACATVVTSGVYMSEMWAGWK